jgi:hypothetical protein
MRKVWPGCDRVGGGRSPKLSQEKRAEFAALVEAGPDPALHKVVRWRRIDLRDEIKRRLRSVTHMGGFRHSMKTAFVGTTA